MGWRNDCPAVWWSNIYFDRFRIIRRDSAVHTAYFGISRKKIDAKNFQIIISLYFFIFCNLEKIKFNSLVTVWNALELSQQITVSLNYSQSIKINIGPSDCETIISSSRRPTILNQRLTDFNTIRWLAGSMGQTTHPPRVWCSKHFFFHNFL